MAAKTDYRAIFSLQKQIIKSPRLTAEEKLQMLEEPIGETLGEKSDNE